MLHFHLELQALIKIAIGNYFDDNEWEWLADVILTCDHTLDLPKVDFELFFAYFVVFLGDFFDIEVKFVWVFDWKMDIYSE